MIYPAEEQSELEICQQLLLSLASLNDGVDAVDWRDFESHCAKVLRENEYTVMTGLCFRDDDRKYQIDVVGVGSPGVLCIDCKAWGRGGGSSRSMRAAEAQRDRTARLKEVVSEAGLAIDPSMDFYPVIVTLKSEGTTLHRGTPIVPFEALNVFLVEFEILRGELTAV